MSRDALIVGINLYDCDSLRSLKAPAEDAEAIAQLLTQFGDFRVHRLPEVIDKTTHAMRIGRKTQVTLTQLEEALVQLFKPTGENIPETALFYFSGHGLRKERGIQEGFLATSDANPALNLWGLRLKWLRELLQESPVRQQIIWLDCCYSGELLNFKDNLHEAEPGNLERYDRCFIAASREYESAYEETVGNHGVLTSALLQALNPQSNPEGLVTNLTLTEHVNQMLKSTTQRPLFANFGKTIILTGHAATIAETSRQKAICPYRGLAYFDCNDEDPQFFYGRTVLTDTLLEKVRDSNFVSVVGASGSGKSSVVRAGLLHQLKQGQRISGSQQWAIVILKPGEQPLQNLAEAFLAPGQSTIDLAVQLHKAQDLINAGAIGLTQLITVYEAPRVVLVIDQFEEVFTLCRNDVDRQQFFECLLGAVEQVGNKLCLVLTLRADFFGKCLQYGNLAKQIENHLVTVKPMNREELMQAITEPAKQVGLALEPELVTQILIDVERSPGSLPLLQYTLTELWQHRVTNWLTLATYNQLGGVRGTLQQRANEVYASLSEEEQATARRIFLELTQLGEGTEDTRRQVRKRDLITAQQPESLIDRVIQRLSTERLIVTSELATRSETSDRVEVIDVAHEALIRYWSRLRQWIEDNRIALKHHRAIEEAAEEWLQKGKPSEPAYLLQGSKLAEAEQFLLTDAETLPLSSLAEEFVCISQAERDRLRRLEQARRRWRTGITIAFPMLIALGAGVFGWQQQQAKTAIASVFLSGNTPRAETIPNLIAALPTFSTEAQKLKAKAEQTGNEADIVPALAYYRRLREMTVKLKDAETVRQAPILLQHQSTLQSISQDSEKSLAELITNYRLALLRQNLDQRNFGQRIPNTQFTDFENQYTGALRVTYQILMREFGAGADLNQDGQLNPQNEPSQLPCDTLLTLDKLWREATQNATGKACGWYGPDFDGFNSPDCTAVSKFQGRPLAYWIFDTNYTYAIDRIKTCLQSQK